MTTVPTAADKVDRLFHQWDAASIATDVPNPSKAVEQAEVAAWDAYVAARKEERETA
jgi:hypothetical protein